MHVLSAADLQSGAAWSTNFGHQPQTITCDSADRNARVFAIFATGSTFISNYAGPDDAKLIAAPFAAAVDSETQIQLTGLDLSFGVALSSDGDTLSAVTRLRNHTFLI